MNEWMEGWKDTREAPVVCDKRDQAWLVYTYHSGTYSRSVRRPHGGEDKKGHERLLEVHHGACNGKIGKCVGKRGAPIIDVALMDREMNAPVYSIIVIRHQINLWATT
jgi:hypothetical protein